MMDRDYKYPDTTGATPESEPCVQEQERCQTVDEQQAAGCTGAQTEPCAPEDASPGVEPQAPAEGPQAQAGETGASRHGPQGPAPELGAPATEAGDLEKLDETIQALTLERDEWKAKAEDYWDRYLRAMSEMDNFRKRTERDIHRRVERGKSELILPLLDVLDNFDRALAAGEQNAKDGQDGTFKAFYDGVVLIRQQILDVLAKEGVQPIEDPVGKMFDPRYHEAVAAQEGGGEHGTIIQELQRGYMYKDQVLRPSRVKVIR